MAKHLVPSIVPTVIDNERFNSNGMVPNADVAHRLATNFNYVSCRAKKALFVRAQRLRSTTSPSSAAEEVWPTYFRLGENSTAIRVVAGMSLTDFGVTLGTPPSFSAVIKDSSGVDVTSKEWFYSGASGGSDVAPGELHHIYDTITGLTANTEYRFVGEALNGVRLAYLTLMELESKYADDTVTAVCDPGELLPAAPIYDAHLGDLIDANNKLWRHNAAPLISWSVDYESRTPLSTTWTTYTNPLDGTSTTVTANSSGFNLFTQYHNTTNRTTVPVKLVIQIGSAGGGVTTDLKITDGTNTLSITGMASSGWYSTTGTIPAQAGTKWDIMTKNSGAGTATLKVLSLYEFEA